MIVADQRFGQRPGGAKVEQAEATAGGVIAVVGEIRVGLHQAELEQLAEEESKGPVHDPVALVLKGIVAQRLLPSERKNAPRRRVPVCEILINTPAVANLIATGKSAQIYSAMETGGALGMQTLEQDLSRLCLAGEISQGTAFALARNSEVVRHRINGAREAV